jgi:mannosyltransferase OCH1-like enzyme
MIPKILHQCWIGEMVPGDIATWMLKIKEMHPDWPYKIWTMEDILPEFRDKPAIRRAAGAANYLRVKALCDYGGIYVDADCEPIRPLDPLLQYDAICGIQDYVAADNYTVRLGSAVMGSSQGHPWAAWQMTNFDYEDGDPAQSVYLASRAPREGLTVLPESAFYPYRWDEDPKPAQDDTYLIHHWTKLWH